MPLADFQAEYLQPVPQLLYGKTRWSLLSKNTILDYPGFRSFASFAVSSLKGCFNEIDSSKGNNGILKTLANCIQLSTSNL